MNGLGVRSVDSYGQPQMIEALNAVVGRLMRQNTVCVVRTLNLKATTGSDHKFNIVPDILRQCLSTSQAAQICCCSDANID